MSDWKAVLLALAAGLLWAGDALAQAAPLQMPMDGTMSWLMMAMCALLVIVLLLAAAALIKYLVFR